MTHECFVNNAGVNISYYKVNEEVGGSPLIIIPGITNSANEVIAAFSEDLPIYHIVISLRGRGKSDSPESNYSLDDQAGDINAVVAAENLNGYFLFGYSVGTGIAIRAAFQNKDKVLGLFLGDFPPFYPPLDKSWGSQVIRGNKLQITKTAVDGLVKDAKYIDLSDDINSLECFIVALKATDENAAIRTNDVEGLQRKCPNVQIIELEDTGHDMFLDNPELVSEVVQGCIAGGVGTES